jgi:prolyl oligopeptidase
MRAGRFHSPFFLAAAVALLGCTAAVAVAGEYPETRRSDQVDDFFGTRVADPYRWLEVVDDPEVVSWVEAQNALLSAYVEPLESRPYIAKRLKELYNYPKNDVPTKRGDWVFVYRNDGLQNQYVLYKQKGLQGEPEVLLDPNELSQEGRLSVGAKGITRDGSMYAYGLHEDGSDWETIYVKEVATGETLEDELERARFTEISWRADNSGFYYPRYAEGEEHFQKLYFHRIGDPQGADELVYERPEDKNLGVSGAVSDDGRYLIVHVWKGTASENEIFVKRLDQEDAEFEALFAGFTNAYEFIEGTGDRLYFVTDKKAPRRRVVVVDMTDPKRRLVEIVPEHARDVLNQTAIANSQLALAYMHNAHHTLRMYSLDGEPLHDVELPTLGALARAGGLRGTPSGAELFVSFSSFLFPSQSYLFDFDAGELELFEKTHTNFDPSAYVARQVFYESKDGTKVPMFLVHRRGVTLDGDNPVLLYGYGGFNISMMPRFSTTWVFWLEQGGILAMPNLRGGGEFGEEWHRAGMLEKKQNVFDDFIAAAEWLIANGYTSPERLCIEGGSNGGLLTAVCSIQRPDLYGAVLVRVPVTDMLRYQHFTIGSYWIPEYGDPTNEEHFDFLYAYSPLHTPQKGVHYPATLITTADTDTRVEPAHAKKFAAVMQECNASDHPILLRVETRAGHGAGTSTAKWVEERADLFAFVMDRLGMEVVPATGAVVEKAAP